MYTIGQVSEMFQLPVSTLRYYDKEGLFPNMVRESGIRKFGDSEIEALKVIECLKKSGLEIRDIKKFMQWCGEGAATYEKRRALFARQKAAVIDEIRRLKSIVDMLDYKCWYYETAIKDGSEERLREVKPENMPEAVRRGWECIHRQDGEDDVKK